MYTSLPQSSAAARCQGTRAQSAQARAAIPSPLPLPALNIAIVRRPSAEMNPMRAAAWRTQPECLMAVIHAGQRGNQSVAERTGSPFQVEHIPLY